MTIKIVTGNVQESLQRLVPDVLVNISDIAGTGAHVLCGVLFREYECYTEMLNRVRYEKISGRNLIGTYCYRNIGNQTHILAFAPVMPAPAMSDPEVTYVGSPDAHVNPALFNILTSLNADMVSSGKRSIILPYYGKPNTGYSFQDFLKMLDYIFDAEITVYVSVTYQFADSAEINNMMVLRFNSPVINKGRRTIYARQQGVMEHPQASYPQHIQHHHPDISRGSPSMVNAGWINMATHT